MGQLTFERPSLLYINLANSKFMKRFLFSTIFLLCSILAFAQFTGTLSDEQGVQYTALDEESCYVSGHDENYNSRIVIPETFKGLVVVGIDSEAFKSCTSLTSVIIGNSVELIGNGAFYECQNLISVTIPNSVIYIEIESFSGCTSLRSVSFGNSVEYIGERAFYHCLLKSVTIGCNHVVIEGNAFGACRDLTSVIIGNGVKGIGSYAFSDCPNLTEVVSLIEEPFEIDESVFGEEWTATLYVPSGSIEMYQSAAAWNKFETIKESVSEGPQVTNLCPDDNHPHMIDLGLPSGTKWACCNVGASNPEDYGGYFAWGETTEKSYYDWSNYIHCDGSLETCHDIGSDIAGTQYDAATANWGVAWVMPNEEQMHELEQYCRGSWTTKNGVNGYWFRSRSSGASIFFPATGSGWRDNMNDMGSYGFYRSSTLYENRGSGSWFLLIDNEGHGLNQIEKSYGLSVRPVAASSSSGIASGIEIMDNEQLSNNNSPIYNLNGQRMQSLQKGINIVNGKKVLMK